MLFEPGTFRWQPLFEAEGVPGTPGTPAEPKTGEPTDYRALYEAEQKNTQSWQSRFAGLQREYQKLKDDHTTNGAKMLDIQKQLEEASGGFEALKIEHTKTKEDFDSRVTEYDVLKAQNERLTTVVTKFPQLIPYLSVVDEATKEVNDLLPDGTGQELEKKLALFAAQLAKTGQTQLQQNLMITPPPPPNLDRSSETVYQEALAALAKGNVTDYNRLMDEYYKMPVQGKK